MDVSGVTVTQSGPRGYIVTDQILVMGCQFVLVIETISTILYTVTCYCFGYKATGLARDEAHMVHPCTHIHT
jgi:hypothetical protein